MIENRFELIYEDNGPGIPKDIMDKNPATVGLMLIKIWSGNFKRKAVHQIRMALTSI